MCDLRASLVFLTYGMCTCVSTCSCFTAFLSFLNHPVCMFEQTQRAEEHSKTEIYGFIMIVDSMSVNLQKHISSSRCIPQG